VGRAFRAPGTPRATPDDDDDEDEDDEETETDEGETAESSS
jgi:hypothetical protein